jgi:hypothetical protein
VTIDEVANDMLSRLVMNTAQGHSNEHGTPGHPGDQGHRVRSHHQVAFGLASQDTGENAVAEVGCTGLRLISPV